MYRKILPFDSDSFIEINSRITGDGELLMLSIRGKKNNNESTVASVLLTEKQAKTLVEFIEGWTPRELSQVISS
jgi:hypothetical protein